MSILVHSSAIPVHSSSIPVDSCPFLQIPVPFLWTPVDSSGMGSFLQESGGMVKYCRYLQICYTRNIAQYYQLEYLEKVQHIFFPGAFLLYLIFFMGERQGI